jgi:hypothetical protein
MFFASPIWLALLLPPWAGVAVWLMWSRRGERTDVPFLALWRGGAEDSPREGREFRPPPVALVAALAAALLAIVAAGRPAIVDAAPRAGPMVTIILDRGVTMSVGDRMAEVIEAARPAVGEAFGDGPTNLVEVPDVPDTGPQTHRLAWSQLASHVPPTQEQTAEAVPFAVRRALATTDGPVVVLSDHAIAEAAGPRVVQIAPAKALQNVAIANFVVREQPRPQAMVTVANDSDRERATLRVRSGERAATERTIDLPRTAGGEVKVFVDLPSLDAAATAEIEVEGSGDGGGGGDDITIDNVAHAKRQRTFPAIEVRAAVPAEVRRVVDAYAKARPAQETSTRIAIVGDGAVPTDLPVAILSSASASDAVGGAVTVAAHPVSAGVDWADAKAQAAGAPPGEGWRAVVSVAGRPAVAVRETSHRQVWMGFHASDFARTPEFVIFWTNVFDWLAGGAAGDAATHWRSVVVPPIKVAPPPSTDWRGKLATLKAPHYGWRDVTSAVLLASVTCLIVAAVAWPGRSLTAISVPRTV